MYELERIEDILVRRDGLTLEEAQERVEEVRAEINAIIDDMASPDREENIGLILSLEDMVQCEFGLEPDYLDQLVD